MAHQHGLNNVVAQMGTALTEAQLKALKRHTQRFILALDSDVAGDQATLRGLDVARQVMDREVAKAQEYIHLGRYIPGPDHFVLSPPRRRKGGEARNRGVVVRGRRALAGWAITLRALNLRPQLFPGIAVPVRCW